MAEMLARDGEGAKHLIRATVKGAKNDAEARIIAKSIVNSPLIKTMVHGSDPNVGRILMAVGKCVECHVHPATIDAWINGHAVVKSGERADFVDATVRATLQEEIIELVVSLGVGEATATAFGCDLSTGYITENAAYLSS